MSRRAWPAGRQADRQADRQASRRAGERAVWRAGGLAGRRESGPPIWWAGIVESVQAGGWAGGRASVRADE